MAPKPTQRAEAAEKAAEAAKRSAEEAKKRATTKQPGGEADRAAGGQPAKPELAGLNATAGQIRGLGQGRGKGHADGDGHLRKR